MEQMQLEVIGLRQQVQNLELNALPAVSQHITTAFDTIAQHQDALTTWQANQLFACACKHWSGLHGTTKKQGFLC